MSNKLIYVVEQGCYSDYRVVGVFSTRENAERVAALINGNKDGFGEDATVAQWELNPCIEELNAGLNRYSICMAYDGSVERCELSTSSYGFTGILTVWKRTKTSAWKGQPISDAVSGTLWAKDEKHAIKIANEFRAQMIYMNKMHRRMSE